MEWISVKDRLPEVYITVMVYYKSENQHGFFSAILHERGWDAYPISATGGNITNFITHWAIPEPPKQN